MAIKHGWDISPEFMQQIPAIVGLMSQGLRVDPETHELVPISLRAQQSAIRLGIQMAGQNMHHGIGPTIDAGGQPEKVIDYSALSIEELELLAKLGDKIEQAGSHPQAIVVESSDEQSLIPGAVEPDTSEPAGEQVEQAPVVESEDSAF